MQKFGRSVIFSIYHKPNLIFWLSVQLTGLFIRGGHILEGMWIKDFQACAYCRVAINSIDYNFFVLFQGAITRQEAVSMIPPLFMDIQPHHLVSKSIKCMISVLFQFSCKWLEGFSQFFFAFKEKQSILTSKSVDPP